MESKKWSAEVAGNPSPRCPKCRQPDRLTLMVDEAGAAAEALCRRCGAHVILEKQDGKWSVVVQGASAAGASVSILQFFGVDKFSDIVNWVEDTL